MSLLKKIDTRFGDSTIWQFVKFNLVSFSITLLQLALANLLPLIFDGVRCCNLGIRAPIFPVKFYCQYLRLFHEYEDHIPRQGKP